MSSWIGRREWATDTIVPAQADRLAALLDLDISLGEGAELPPLWHWIYFAPRTRQSDLGTDGHPKLGGFLPPAPLPRRMWAGGRLKFLKPIRVGATVTRETEILRIDQKVGRQGRLFFLTLRHLLREDASVTIEEEQDIVYREPGETTLPPPLASEARPAAWREAVTTDPTILFRYSALTFNAHRIHYDLSYATGEEGYPGLVVHGPLTATLLAWSAHRRNPAGLGTFCFRGQAPLFCGKDMRVCGNAVAGFELWAEGPGGYVGMAAEATMRAV